MTTDTLLHLTEMLLQPMPELSLPDIVRFIDTNLASMPHDTNLPVKLRALAAQFSSVSADIEYRLYWWANHLAAIGRRKYAPDWYTDDHSSN